MVIVRTVGREETQEDGLVDGHVLVLHVVEDGGGPRYVPRLAVQGHAVLERHSVGLDIFLLKRRHELRDIDIILILLMNLRLQN